MRLLIFGAPGSDGIAKVRALVVDLERRLVYGMKADGKVKYLGVITHAEMKARERQ